VGQRLDFGFEELDMIEYDMCQLGLGFGFSDEMLEVLFNKSKLDMMYRCISL
jgi:hypothetical protein